MRWVPKGRELGMTIACLVAVVAALMLAASFYFVPWVPRPMLVILPCFIAVLVDLIWLSERRRER